MFIFMSLGYSVTDPHSKKSDDMCTVTEGGDVS